jgi:hypothetical protein
VPLCFFQSFTLVSEEKLENYGRCFPGEYDLQKDVLNAVLLAFERKAGEWCDVVTLVVANLRSAGSQQYS